MAGADQAGGGAGEDRLDRPGAGEGRRDQRAVAAHHHQRAGDVARGEETLGGGDQPVDHRDQPRVEQRGERAARAAELGRQLVAGGDRQAGLLADQVAGGDLVRRVARREIGADGKARHALRQFRQRGFEAGQVERGGAAMHVVSARAKHDRIGAERGPQAVAGKVGFGEADHDQRHAAALALDQRVGGERGRHRGELYRRRIDLGFGEHPVDRARNADREVVAGGQRLRLGDDLSTHWPGVEPVASRHSTASV